MGAVVETPVGGCLIVRVARMLRCLDPPEADVPDDALIGAVQSALIRRVCDAATRHAVYTLASAGSHASSGRTRWLCWKGSRICSRGDRIDDALVPRYI